MSGNEGTGWVSRDVGKVQHAAGRLSVDPERVPQLIARLELAVELLVQIDDDAKRGGQMDPPGEDGYSAIAARAISRQSSDEDGCHGSANLAYRESLQNVVAQLRAHVAAVQQADDDNAVGWRQGLT